MIGGNALGVGLPVSPTVVANVDVHFSRDRATTDGATGGGDPAQLAKYDVANTDFFEQLNQFIDDPAQRFQKVDPRAVISGQQSLLEIRSLVLADDPLPGYTGSYAATTQPSGGPTADKPITSAGGTFPGAGSGAPGTSEEFPFTIGPNDENSKVDVTITWASANDDFDLTVDKIEDNGDRTEVGSSANGGTTSESTSIANPGAGDYVVVVDNFAAAPTRELHGHDRLHRRRRRRGCRHGDLHRRREGRLAGGAGAVRPRRRQPRPHRRRPASAPRPDHERRQPDPGQRGRPPDGLRRADDLRPQRCGRR